jgi:hypothetical protein
MEETSWKINNLVNDKCYRREHKNKKSLTDPLKFLYGDSVPPVDTRFYVEEGFVSKEDIVNNLDPSKMKLNQSSISLGPLGKITTDVSGVTDISFGNMGMNILGILSGKRDYADHELNEDLKKNKTAFFSSLKIGACIGGQSKKDEDKKDKEDKGASKDNTITKQMNAGISDISAELKENPIFQFIKENLKYVEYPYIYFRWLEKKIGINLYKGLAKLQNVKLLDKKQTEAEIRLVNDIISKIASLLITIFVTYNWFFMMFYQEHNQRMIGWRISSKSLSSVSPFLNFVLEFVLYPAECINWFMLSFLPDVMKKFFVSSDLIFLVMYVTIYKTMNTWGYAIVDLFYDSLKIFFNHRVKPWDPELHHVYTNPDKPVSPTLRTYWFLHILIFGGQIPSFIPNTYQSYYNSKKNKTAEEKEENINRIVEDILPERTEMNSGIDIDEIIDENDKSHQLKKGGQPGSAVTAEAAVNKPSPIIKAAVPGIPSLASGVTGVASGFISGATSKITNIIRFAISHYFVTIAAMCVAFYLMFYSFFAIIRFSKIGLFDTILEIEDYIQEDSTDNYKKRCGIKDCSDSWFDWIYDKIGYAYHKAIQAMFNHLYVGAIVAILLAGIANTAKVMTSSKPIRLSFKLIFGLAAFSISIIYMFKHLVIDAYRGRVVEPPVVLNNPPSARMANPTVVAKAPVPAVKAPVPVVGKVPVPAVKAPVPVVKAPVPVPVKK